MIKDKRGYIIQAFPINRNTFVGIANGVRCSQGVIHAVEDGTLDLLFENNTVSITVIKGQDIGIDNSCKGVTSSGEVMITR